MGGQLPTTIAIDGPAASGKNTVGILLARRLGYPFVDSGAMYRAVTLRALAEGVGMEDHEALAALARRLRFHFTSSSERFPAGRIFVDGQDVTDALRDPMVDAHVSLVARIPEVREILVRQQRKLAEDGPIIMAGRDIGTVVLPDADLKVYLDASSAERAYRRYRELRSRGETVEFAQVLADLEQRDRLDREREASPLRPAPDALVMTTDSLTPDEVVAQIMHTIADC